MKRHFNFNKRYIYASENGFTSQERSEIISALKSKGINMTKHRYKISWREYEGMDRGNHTRTITAPGDYMALFALRLKSSVTWDNLSFQWDVDDILYIIETWPTISEFKTEGPADEWACPDEYSATFYLENLDTHKVLWDHEYEELEYEEDEDEEDEEWE